MPVSLADFDNVPGTGPAAGCRMFDAERPFLFEGLEPRYATRIIRSVFVPMRDGVRLSTDLHVPLGAKLPLPVVLLRTPYGKELASHALPALLPEQGIIFAVQDVRGRYESEGDFVACTGQDREDGVDMLDWLVDQPWCSGAVGTIGSSYTGETAAKLAAMRHPAHKCGVIMFDGAYGGGAVRNGAYLQHGITMLRMMFGWYRDYVPKVSFGPPPHVDREAFFRQYHGIYATQPVAQPPVDLDTHLLTLPVHDLLDRSGAAPSEFGEQMRRSADPTDPYWQSQGFLTEEDRFATPTIFLSGPLERGSSFDDHRLFRAGAATDAAREHQYLWFTPAEHSGFARCGPDTRYGVRDLGDTGYPYYGRLLAWFGHWLRGDPLDLSAWAKVDYYMIGANRWQSAEQWPPAQVHERALHLCADGSLGDDPGAEGERSFTYDPADPTPSEPPDSALDLLGVGYADRSAIDRRDDVLSWTSAPLDAPLALAGALRAVVHISSDAPDTDVFVMLSEVDGEGRSVNIMQGYLRLRFREGYDRPLMLTPGEPVEARIDMWHVALEVPAGHRLRVAIASSAFPAFDRNLNTGGNNYTDTEWRTATNIVHSGPATPSRIILPVLPR